MPGFDLMRCVRDKTCFRSSFSARILTLTLVLLVLFAQVRARDCVGKLTVEEVKGGGMLDKREGMCEERCGHSTWSIQNWVFPVFISFLPPPPTKSVVDDDTRHYIQCTTLMIMLPTLFVVR